MKEYLQESAHVIKDVASDGTYGLAASEAASRLEKGGPNKLREAEKDPLWKRFFSQMADPMIIMLIVAAVISALTGLAQGEADFADVIIICFVVVVNAVLGVVQESKAEEALAALQEMSAAQSKVVRDGKVIAVPSSELVIGDLVILEAGDSVPADCRIMESASMKIEEAALTGESVPVNKVATVLDAPDDGKDVPLGDRKNMCYMGSTVVYGRGRAVVVATGMGTEMGKIADALTRAGDEQTPLQKKLDELSKTLSVICIVICAMVFTVTWLKHGMGFFGNMPLVLNTLMVAVSLAVAAIPEGLAAVVTIVLSIGVTKMSQHNAIIRKLSAVETLGCTQVICSDKTGTLTQNKMTVVRHFTEDQGRLVRCMALCSDAKWDSAHDDAVGEPTEAALVADAAKLGFTSDDLDAANPRVGEAPFDSGRKMMSVVNRAPDGTYIQHTKGGPDVVLARCTMVRTANGDVPLTDEWRQRIMEANKAMADDALRVMAAARVSYGTTAPTDFSPEALEHDMTFLGLCGMIDPVRPEVKQAVVEAHSAGMRVVMITGDHIDTAVAIAKELGIIVDRSQAITGAELDRMSDEEFERDISAYDVYARVQPEHKTRIVDTWKRLGKVVAMTGDGVNDAPSIKRADIGVGMGITGTDVTKNVADMVLADDNFATIINACEEGRRIYDNIRKSIAFLLSSNLAEVISVFVASLIGFTILEPTHLLWINLITDSFPALAMAMEEAEPDIMKREPRNASDGVFANGMGLDCLVQGGFI
ncbi:MAG: HAD-IC family P-type ATPase, partial [Coriobacteriaceae bacterium]|nr:HAD-IC family P-type ATPase [Coriobacteriaceae bacterium]